ncbi:LOW QUALITY PROTEIN: hypothetical protein KIPB_014566, partial [Kipferlia bialata]
MYGSQAREKEQKAWMRHGVTAGDHTDAPRLGLKWPRHILIADTDSIGTPLRVRVLLKSERLGWPRDSLTAENDSIVTPRRMAEG